MPLNFVQQLKAMIYVAVLGVSLTKWFIVGLRSKWLWVRVPLQSLKCRHLLLNANQDFKIKAAINL